VRLNESETRMSWLPKIFRDMTSRQGWGDFWSDMINNDSKNRSLRRGQLTGLVMLCAIVLGGLVLLSGGRGRDFNIPIIGVVLFGSASALSFAEHYLFNWWRERR